MDVWGFVVKGREGSGSCVRKKWLYFCFMVARTKEPACGRKSTYLYTCTFTLTYTWLARALLLSDLSRSITEEFPARFASASAPPGTLTSSFASALPRGQAPYVGTLMACFGAESTVQYYSTVL